MTIQPAITEAQRNELRVRAAQRMAAPGDNMVRVSAAHLLDLLDCADREGELIERLELDVIAERNVALVRMEALEEAIPFLCRPCRGVMNR